MPMTEELTAQIDTAIDNVIEESKEVTEEKNIEVKDEVKVEPDEKSNEVAEEVDSGSDLADDEKSNPVSDVEQSEESKVKEEVVIEAVKPVISDQTLTAAVQAGFSVAEARAFQSDESLMRAVAVIESIKEKVRPVEEEKDLFPEALKLDPEKYEPEVIEMYNSLWGVVKKQHEELKELKSQTAEQTKQSNFINQEATTREVTEWFDGQVKKLGDNFHEILGKGGFNSLQPGSSQHAKQEAIAGQVAVLMAGYNAAGMQPPPRDELFNMSARLVLGDEFQKVREKKLTGDLAKRSSQHINRAGGRSSKSSGDPMEETARMLNEKFFAKAT